MTTTLLYISNYLHDYSNSNYSVANSSSRVFQKKKFERGWLAEESTKSASLPVANQTTRRRHGPVKSTGTMTLRACRSFKRTGRFVDQLPH